MAQPNPTTPEKATAPVAAQKPAPEKATAPPAPEPDDDDIPADAVAIAAAGAPAAEGDRLAATLDRLADKLNPGILDKALVRATKQQPQGVAPAVPDIGHAIITDEYRTFRRQIPTAHIMHPSGRVVEVGPAGREIPTGLSYDNVKAKNWTVECFSPHPDELLVTGDGEQARKFIPSYPFDAKKYRMVDGVLWHPNHAPAKK